MTNQPIDPPKGCQEIPGYIIEVARGGLWLRNGGPNQAGGSLPADAARK